MQLDPALGKWSRARLVVLVRRWRSAPLKAHPESPASVVGDAIRSDVVVLAVPYAAIEDVLGRYERQLDGRVIVDIANPVEPDDVRRAAGDGADGLAVLVVVPAVAETVGQLHRGAAEGSGVGSHRRGRSGGRAVGRAPDLQRRTHHRGAAPRRHGAAPHASGYGLTMPNRLLIAVGGAAASPEAVPSGVRTLIEAADEIVVIAPTLPSRLQWLVSDTDTALERADERLRTVLGHLEEIGASARGRVGSDDPLTAFDDAIRELRPSHILVALRPEERAGWQERGLIDEVLARFGLPVTVFMAAHR